jgi:creatinine amidohydrolase
MFRVLETAATKRAVSVLLLSFNALLALAQTNRSATRETAMADRSRIHKIEELRWPQIDALNRERTLFILPIGMLEEHGPHLPIGADTFGVLYEANGVSRQISKALSGWNVVMMPTINYGQGGANQAGGILVHSGTYAIRQSTLRSLVADVGGQVAQNGFKWIFVMTGHGAPANTIAINEACDFISETFNVTMLHLTALFKGDAGIQSKGKGVDAKHFSAAERASFGMDVHAGVGETSVSLARRPDLVDSRYKALPARVGHNFDELLKIASQHEWQGYFSSPAKANAAYGRSVEAWWIEGLTELILRAIRGENMFKHPRLPEAGFGSPAVGERLKRGFENERAFEQKLENWMAKRKKN